MDLMFLVGWVVFNDVIIKFEKVRKMFVIKVYVMMEY